MAICLLGLGSFGAGAQYCLPNYSTGCAADDNINSFTVTGAGSTSIFDTGTHCSAGAYRNMSGSMSVSMAQGSTYAAYINSDYFDESAEVFIDFNNDGTFSASESVGGDDYIDDIGKTFSLNIPAGATTGTHRMRVVMSYDYYYGSIDACPDSTNGYLYGEVHDYAATITAGSTTACTAPAGTSASGMTASSAMLMWSAVPGASGYEYVINQTSGVPSGSGTATTAIAVTPTTLGSNTLYYLHVRTKCGTTTFSPWVEQQFVTTTASPTCVAPDSFTLSALTNNAATLQWKAVSGSTGYEIFVSSVLLYPLNGTMVSTTGSSYSGLTPNSSYYAFLRHYCSATDVSDWAIMTFRTNSPFGTGSSISGNIYKNATGVPSSDSYKVWLINYNSAAGTLTAVDSVKVTGTYAFSGKPNGSYLIKAAQLNGPVGTPGQVPTYHDSSLYWNTALPAFVSGSNLTKHIWMQQGTTTSGPGFIGGNVSLGANKGAAGGVPNMLIVLRNAANKLVKAVYTTAAGDFSFSSLPAGTYNVYPEQMGYATTVFSSITITSTQASRTGINFNQDDMKKSIKPRTTGVGNTSVHTPLLTLAPNPAKNTVMLAWQGFEDGLLNVTITTITGQAAMKQDILAAGKSAAAIDISALQPGVYFIHLQSASGGAVQKLVVEP